MLTTQQAKTLKQLDETLQYYWQQHTSQPAEYGQIIHIITASEITKQTLQQQQDIETRLNHYKTNSK